MAGNIKVGGHTVFTHTGPSGAGTLSVQGQNGSVLLSDDGTGVSLGNNVKLPATGGISDSSGNPVLTESGGNVSIGNVRLPSTGGVSDSSGNAILTESGGNVSIGDVRLPTSGGIKDSAGNNVLSESGGNVSIGNVRLPATGGISDSSGNSILTESGGVASLGSNVNFDSIANDSISGNKINGGTISNSTLASTTTFPAGMILQIKSSSIYADSTYKSLSRMGTGQQLVDGLSISFVPKKANSEIIFSLKQLYITGNNARAIMSLWAKNTTTPLSTNNFDYATKQSGTNQVHGSNINLGLVSTSGWTQLGRLAYRTASSSLISSSDVHCTNAILPSYNVGDTLQFAIAIGNDTAGYSTTLIICGNSASGNVGVTIFEKAV